MFILFTSQDELSSPNLSALNITVDDLSVDEHNNITQDNESVNSDGDGPDRVSRALYNGDEEEEVENEEVQEEQKDGVHGERCAWFDSLLFHGNTSLILMYFVSELVELLP